MRDGLDRLSQGALAALDAIQQTTVSIPVAIAVILNHQGAGWNPTAPIPLVIR